MDTVARIPNNSPISCIHTFRSQSPHFPTSSAAIRVGRGSWTPIRASTAEREEVLLAPPRKEDQQLKNGIAEFYDESSSLWENIWGDHMHHGFYDPDSTVSVSDHRAAQIRMIEESLRFASVSGIRFASNSVTNGVCVRTCRCTVTNCLSVTEILIWNWIFWYWVMYIFFSCLKVLTNW